MKIKTNILQKKYRFINIFFSFGLLGLPLSLQANTVLDDQSLADQSGQMAGITQEMIEQVQLHGQLSPEEQKIKQDELIEYNQKLNNIKNIHDTVLSPYPYEKNVETNTENSTAVAEKKPVMPSGRPRLVEVSQSVNNNNIIIRGEDKIVMYVSRDRLNQ